MRWILFLSLSTFIACNRSTIPDDTAPKQGMVLEPKDSALMLIDPLSIFWGSDSDSAKADTISKAEVSMLREGDIVLRKGYGAVSDFIAVYLNEDYPVTHCAFVLTEGYPETYVLHTVSNDSVNGVFTETLLHYVGQSKIGSVAAVRLKGEENKRQAVIKEAKGLLDKGIAFDMGFDDEDTTKMYCAEMMRHVFKKVYSKDLLDKRAKKYGLDVIHMSNFFNPENFEVVFNHFETIKKDN